MFLLIAAIAGWRVLQSPSTMGFFAFELGIAIAVGLFLSLRTIDSWRHPEQPPRDVLSPEQTDTLRSRPRITSPTGSSTRALPGSERCNGGRRHNRRVFLGLSAFFFLVVALAVVDLSHSLNVASIQFYALVAIAASVLAVNVYINGESRSGFLLMQVTILAILAKFHFLYLNPYVYTSDNYIHFTALSGLAAEGYVPGPTSYGHYFFFPGFVIFAYSGTSLTGVSLELFNGIGFISQIAMIPIVYLVGRNIASRRMGLFASILGLLSIFTFLYTHATPTHYGVEFLFLALYAAIRIDSTGQRRWLGVFWVGAMAALFSHPVNAAVLALVLIVRALWFRKSEHASSAPGLSVTPALSYGVAYGGYLAFVAYRTFDLFVRSFLSVDYEPPLASIPSAMLEENSMFIFQSALAPLGLSIPILFGGYAILLRGRILKSEHRFLVALGAAFLLLPASEFAAGNFKLQSSRMLVYLAIPVVLLAAHGLVGMLRHVVSARRAASMVLAVFLFLGFIASSSYLTQNDSRDLYSDVPFSPTHLTTSALSSRQFLNLTPSGSLIYLDSGTARYFEDSNRAREAILGHEVRRLESFNMSDPQGFLVLNAHYIPYGGPTAGTFYNVGVDESFLTGAGALRLYDAGDIRIYFVP